MAWEMPYLVEVTRIKAVINSVECPVRMATINTRISQKAMNGEMNIRVYRVTLLSSDKLTDNLELKL